MPYIPKEDRKRALNSPKTVGELNYAITMLVLTFMDANGGLSYTNVNNAVGALQCASLELYRRVAAPYEDGKVAANGDVYPSDFAPPVEAARDTALGAALKDKAREDHTVGMREQDLSDSEMLAAAIAEAERRGPASSEPPKSNQPQRDVQTIVSELDCGMPLGQALAAGEAAAQMIAKITNWSFTTFACPEGEWKVTGHFNGRGDLMSTGCINRVDPWTGRVWVANRTGYYQLDPWSHESRLAVPEKFRAKVCGHADSAGAAEFPMPPGGNH